MPGPSLGRRSLASGKAPTNAQLQQLAQACGLAKSGTKSQLASRLVSALAAHKAVSPGERILSIDMGLRNFAFCHFTLGRGSPDTTDSRAVSAEASPKRRGPRARAKKPTTPDASPQSPPPLALKSTLMPKLAGPVINIYSWEVLDVTAAGAEAGVLDYGSKAGMSTLAIDIVRRYLLQPALLRPTRVLIEQQRYRTRGGSSVQEWTLRVNELEAMLHAVLATMRSLGFWDGVVEAVNPSRAAGHFFDSLATSGEEQGEAVGEEKVPIGRSRTPAKTLKKMKIDMLGGWIWGGCEARTAASVTIKSPEAERTADLFLQKRHPVKKASKSRRTKNNVDADDITKIPQTQAKKLDDLTDCVIQGAAWASWQDMRTALAQNGTRQILEELIQEPRE